MARSDGDELAVLSCYSVKVRCLFKFAALLWQHVTAFMQRQGWRRSQLDGVAPAAWQERSLSWTLDRYSHSYRKLWMGCLGLEEAGMRFSLSPCSTFPSAGATWSFHLPFSLISAQSYRYPTRAAIASQPQKIHSRENLRNLARLSFAHEKTEPTGEVTCPALKRQRWYLDLRLLLCSPVPRPHPGLIHVSFPVPGFLLCLLPMALGVFKTGPWPDGMWKGWRLLSRKLVPDVTSPEVALRAPALPAPPPLYRKSSFPDSPGQVCPELLLLPTWPWLSCLRWPASLGGGIPQGRVPGIPQPPSLCS